MINRFQIIKDSFSSIISKKFSVRIFYIISGIFFISVLGLIFTRDIELWIDIGIADEAKYLGDGVNFFRTQPDPSWGPLYSLWYYFLNLFSRDTINLYYQNYRLMTILPSIALYLFFLKMKVTPTLSFYFSFALLISMINLPTWPKVSHFGLTLIFIGFIIVHNIKGKNTRLLAALFISLIITYIRPEFILSSIILFGIILKRAVKNDFGKKQFMMAILTTLIFFLLFGIPYSPGRNLTAFGQAYHKYLDLSDRIDEDGVKDWTEILSENFGNPKTITDVVLNNSNKFIKHIGINLSKLPLLYLSSIETLLPNKIFPISRLIKILIVLSIISSVFVLLLFNKMGKYREIILNGFAEKKDLLIFSIIFSLPPLLSMILYYPRSHYILLLLPLIYLVVGQMIIPLKFNNYIKNVISFCFLILVSFLLIPQLSSVLTKSNFKNLIAVQSIKNLNISERINILENEGGLNVYLPENYKWIRVESKEENFDEFVDESKINMIYYSNSLNNSVQLKRDSTWFEFLMNPDAFGFKKLIKDYGRIIYIRKDIKVN
ncbi:MAG: hypothetical protein BMS9Abin39_0315 [Ignavibacteria bacterium]|nr:MAG: hypothetical protein BMS9Abin39_0315 [Ignavibacteria bacterium]